MSMLRIAREWRRDTARWQGLSKERRIEVLTYIIKHTQIAGKFTAQQIAERKEVIAERLELLQEKKR